MESVLKFGCRRISEVLYIRNRFSSQRRLNLQSVSNPIIECKSNRQSHAVSRAQRTDRIMFRHIKRLPSRLKPLPRASEPRALQATK